MPIRSKSKALEEAVKRWGKNAAIKQTTCTLFDEIMWQRKPPRLGPLRPTCAYHSSPCPGNRPAFAVGEILMGVMFAVRGSGASWDEAFTNADKNR